MVLSLQCRVAMNKTSLLMLSAVFALSGCVSKGKYDQAVAQTETTRAELSKSTDQVKLMTSELEARKIEIDRQKAEIARLEALDESKSGESRTRIGELQKRLSELQAAQRATEIRAALYKSLTMRLKKQIDDGDLQVVVRDGRMVLQLPNDVLFDTGRTELKAAGKSALAAIAEVMASMPDRHFQIAGHTDNVPIHNDMYASNWELSSGRALRVVHYLVSQGVPEGELSAAGYSEVDPVASNQTPEGRKKNRRTEITLQPNIDELVKIPQ